MTSDEKMDNWEMKISTWKINDLIQAATKTDPAFKKKIVIPDFQRKRVWSDDQKEYLIDSLIEKYPIGVITLYRLSVDQNIEKFILLDGLQRTMTIIEYFTNPLKFKLNNKNFDDAIEGISRFYPDIGIEPIREIIQDWIIILQKNYTYEDLIKKKYTNSNQELREICRKYIDNKKNHNKLDGIFDKIIEKTNSICDKMEITNIELPIQICYNNPAQLYKIFERLNTTGTALKAHEIYAATWYQYGTFIINNKEIILEIKNYNIEKKTNIFDVNIESNINRKPGEYTYYEYLIGFKNYIHSKYELKYLTEEYMLELIQSIIDIPNQANIGKSLDEIYKSGQLQKTEEQVMRTFKFINDKFNFFLKNGIKPNRTEFIVIFKTIYDNYDILSNNELYIDKILINLLYYNIQQYWSFKTMSYNYMKEAIDSTWYINPIKSAEFQNAMNGYFNKQNINKCNKRCSISKTNKLILYIIYRKQLTKGVGTCEIEHTIPVDKFNKIDKNNKGNYPVNHIGNLCYLNKTINQKKKNQTLLSYINNLNNLNNNDKQKIRDILEKDYFFSSLDELNIIDGDFTSDKYLKYLDKRFKIQLEKIIKLYDSIWEY